MAGWQVWDGTVLLVDGLPSHADAWREVDRRTRRENWKSGSCEFRNLGSLATGRVVPPLKSRKASKNIKKMWRRAPKVCGCNRKHRCGRSQ
jgi:hypothetical protein